MELFLGTM